MSDYTVNNQDIPAFIEKSIKYTATTANMIVKSSFLVVVSRESNENVKLTALVLREVNTEAT